MALRSISTFARTRAVPILRQALRHPEALGREHTGDALDQLEALAATPALLPLLDEPHAHVRQAAQTAVENLRSVQHD